MTEPITRTRSLRAIQLDMTYAAARFRRAGRLGYIGCAVLTVAALLNALSDGDWRSFAMVIGIITLAVVSAYFTRRGNQIAAVLLLLAFTGAVVAAYVTNNTFGSLVLVALMCGYWLFDGCRAAFELVELRTEYAKTWTPRIAQPGDLFSVRDGDQFAIAKLLALEPGERVHVKLYSVRYPSRPNIVKSATLLQAPAPGHRPIYEHLPLDLAEFLRWEPALMRPEPVEPEELEPLKTWYRVTGAGAGTIAEPDAS